MLQLLIDIILPVVLCVCVGYGWVRFGWPFELKFASALVRNIAAPCLIVSSLANLNISPAAFTEMALATACALVGFSLFGWAILKLSGHSVRVFLGPLTFANTGNMGLPVSLFAFGQAGLSLAAIIFCINALFQFSFSPFIASGKFSFREMLRTPLIYAVLIVIILIAFQLQLPVFVTKTLTLLGNITIGLMLITLGVSLASFKVSSIGLSLYMAILRLALGLGAGIGVSYLFGFDDIKRGVFILVCSMPSAVFTYLIAEHYTDNSEDVAGVIVVSTLLSFIVLPIILRFLV